MMVMMMMMVFVLIFWTFEQQLCWSLNSPDGYTDLAAFLSLLIYLKYRQLSVKGLPRRYRTKPASEGLPEHGSP